MEGGQIDSRKFFQISREGNVDEVIPEIDIYSSVSIAQGSEEGTRRRQPEVWRPNGGIQTARSSVKDNTNIVLPFWHRKEVSKALYFVAGPEAEITMCNKLPNLRPHGRSKVHLKGRVACLIRGQRPHDFGWKPVCAAVEKEGCHLQ